MPFTPPQSPAEVERFLSKNEGLDVKNLVPLPPPYDDWEDQPIPELTEERRREITKIVKKITEEHRVSVRQFRREANEELKKSQKDKEITEDELHRGMEQVQKEVDNAISELDKMEQKKEKEIMEI